MGVQPDVSIQNADSTDPSLVYSGLLQQHIDGGRRPALLNRLTLMASQAGDKPGARQASADYIASLSQPLSEDDIHTVALFTQCTADPGFKLMTDDSAAFRKGLGDRPYVVALMNSIYRGDIEPFIIDHPKPDWTSIANRVNRYGAPGNEILLRAETIFYLNNQEWTNYVTKAKEYIARYEANLRNSGVYSKKCVRTH